VKEMKTDRFIFGFLLILVGLAIFVLYLGIMQQYSSSIAQFGMVVSEKMQAKYLEAITITFIGGVICILGILICIYAVLPTTTSVTQKSTEKLDRQEKLEVGQIELLECPECAKELMPGFKLCPYCGFELKPSICPKCGNQVSVSFNLCPYCGAKLREK